MITTGVAAVVRHAQAGHANGLCCPVMRLLWVHAMSQIIRLLPACFPFVCSSLAGQCPQ